MSTAPQRWAKTVSEERLISISYAGKLESGESLTGTPVITISSPSVSPEDMTISNISISSTILTINGVSVAVGAAIQFMVAGGVVASSPYTISISVGTDAAVAQAFNDNVILKVIED